MLDSVSSQDETSASRARAVEHTRSEDQRSAPAQSGFDRALEQAETARSKADHKPVNDHGYENDVQVKPGDSLSSLAQAGHQSLSGVEADNPQIADPNLIYPGQVVFIPRQPTPQEAQSGTAVASARAAQRQVASLENEAERSGPQSAAEAELPQARAEAGQQWQNVQNVIAGQFRAIGGATNPFPEDAIAPRLAELRSQAQGDPDFQSAVNGAADTVDREWQSEDRTHAQLDPLYADSSTLQRAEQHAAMLQTKLPEAKTSADKAVDRARTDLVDTVQRELQQAAGHGSAGQREAAIAKAALQMQLYGPRNDDFSAAVDQAAYNLTVQPGINAVADAYHRGGAQAAAKALFQQEQSVSPETAARILAGSQPTVDKIAGDLGKEANDLSFSSFPQSPLSQGLGGEGKEFDQTYSDLAKSVDLASRAPGGQTLVTQVADAVAAKIPPLPSQNQPLFGQSEPADQAYGNAATAGIANGDPAGFSAAIAASLQQAGRHGEASYMLGATARGLDQFKNKVVSDVQAYGNAAATINSLTKNWSGVLTPQQMSQATAKYLAANPSMVKSINSARSTLDQDGYAIVRDNMELAQLDPALKPISGYQSYNASRAGITDRTPEATVALALSQKAHAEVARAVLQSSAEGVKGTAAISLDDVNMLKNDKEFVKQLGNSILSQSVGSSVDTGQNFPIDARRLTPFGAGVSIAGAALYGLATWQSLQNLSRGGASPLNDLKTAYNAVGFGKESTEFGALAATYLAQRAGTTLPTDVSAILSQQGPWANFNVAFKLTGGALDSATAIQDLVDHKDGQAASSFLSAGGNFALGLRAAQDAGLIGDDGVAGAIIGADWLGPVAGAAVALGATGVAFFDQLQANNKWKSSNGGFLADAGLRPEIAHAIADQEPDLGSPGPVLKALAHYLGTTSSNIVNYLNTQNPGTVNGFIGSALIVPQNKYGSFPETAANDETAGSSNYLGSEPLSDGLPSSLNYAPESLRALALLAENHFKDFPGRRVS
jgi:hypothetical protein